MMSSLIGPLLVDSYMCCRKGCFIRDGLLRAKVADASCVIPSMEEVHES